MPPSPEPAKLLDKTGRKILFLLQEAARTPFAEIGRQVGLSAPAVAERVRRMEAAGIITGYHASVDAGQLGRPVTVYVEFTSRDGQTGLAEQLALGHPAVSECYCISGERDMLMRTTFASVSEVEPFLEIFTPYGKATTMVVLAATRARQSLK